MDVNGDNAIITPDNNIHDNGGDGVEVTGNTAYIHNNEINRNGGDGIRVSGVGATVSGNTVTSNGIREHTRPSIPQIDVNGFTQQMTYYRNLLEQVKEAHYVISLDPEVILSEEYWIIPPNIKMLLYASSSVSELIMEVLGEITSSFTIEEYCDALDDVYGGDVEVKLTGLGTQGNGIYAYGDNSQIFNNIVMDNGKYGCLLLVEGKLLIIWLMIMVVMV